MLRSFPTFFAVVLFWLAGTAHAATPASGELTDTSGPVTFTGGPYFVPNPGAIAADVPISATDCQVAPSCDKFALKVAIADKFRTDPKNSKQIVQVVMTFTPPNPALAQGADIDLYLLDSGGNVVGSSTEGMGVTTETINVPLKTLKDGDYTVVVTTGVPLGSTASVDIHIGKPGKAGELTAACSLPGLLIAEDAKGDANPGPVTTTGGVVPDPIAADDILQLYVAEPATLPGLVAVTLKTAGLAQVPPQTRWVTYFTVPDGQQWYVAMSTANLGSEASPIFEYGTVSVLGGSPAPAVGAFARAGALDANSGFNADGTITLVLDPALVGLKPGDLMDNIFSSVRRSTPSETQNVGLTADTTSDQPGKYTLAGAAGCGRGKSADVTVVEGKEGSGLALGAFGLPALLLLSGLALVRRRRE